MAHPHDHLQRWTHKLPGTLGHLKLLVSIANWGKAHSNDIDDLCAMLRNFAEICNYGVDVDVHLWWEFVGRSSVRIAQRIERVADGAAVAQARVTCAWLGPSRRLTRMPQAFGHSWQVEA